MKKNILFIFCLTYFSNMTFAQNTLAPTISTVEEYFGIKVTDEYRNLENIKDSATLTWMKSQTDYANSILKNISNRQYYIDKRIELDRRKSFSIGNINITGNGIYFYLKKKPEESNYKLYTRNSFGGVESEIFNPQIYKPENKKNYQINYIKPNYDGSKVAIALTEGGKEISEMIIYDVKNRKLLPDVITNCWPSDGGGISWLPNNISFIYLYYPVIDSNSPLFLKNMESIVYTIGDNDQKLNDIFSKKNNPELKINSEDFPIVNLPYQECKFLFAHLGGATNFADTYYKHISKLKSKNSWKLLFDKNQKISDYIIKGNNIIYITEKSGESEICLTSLINPNFENPKKLVPSLNNEVINSIYNLKDGFLFNSTKNGVEAKLYIYKNNNLKTLSLPFPSGDISVKTQNMDSNKFWIICSGWKNDFERFKYDSSSNKFLSENLAPIIDYPEFKDIVVEEITVKSHDGLDIPLSLIYKKGTIKNSLNPLLIDAYGSYGYNNSPYFARTYLLWALQGGIIAVAHVRGGGEKGEKWHMGGFKETKSNSWKDLISCAEYLVKEKYTSSSNIGIWGASAGGITIGRAMTERPDLFKAVIIDAGVVNASRMEFTPNGLNNVKELGSLKIESEFKSLLEMDAFQHIKKGEKYPATLITGGMNDPRVSPWMPSKFAAKLKANNSSDNPILLKIDYDGGHGGDIPTSQKYSNLADTFAFAFWQLGHPNYQPKKDD